MILATKTHTFDSSAPDSKLFLDIDLSILGAPSHIYREYSRAIRREFGWVPRFLYRRGRREVLQGFLSRPSIFFTDEMRNRFESQARLNIKTEIEELS